MGRDNFEKIMRERFEGAEIQPSERLWTGIEAAIANDEASRYKRGMAYYRWIAAAGLILILSYLGYRGFDAKTNNNIVDQTEIEQPILENTTDIKTNGGDVQN